MAGPGVGAFWVVVAMGWGGEPPPPPDVRRVPPTERYSTIKHWLLCHGYELKDDDVNNAWASAKKKREMWCYRERQRLARKPGAILPSSEARAERRAALNAGNQAPLAPLRKDVRKKAARLCDATRRPNVGMPDSAWRASPRAKPASLRCDGNGLSDAGDESNLISFEELLDCAFGVLHITTRSARSLCASTPYAQFAHGDCDDTLTSSTARLATRRAQPRLDVI